MLKKTITYTNFNDEEVTEDHFFHFSKAELVEMEMSHEGGMSAVLERIIQSNNGKEIIAEFKKIVLGAYGKKSPDGKRFLKSQEIRDEFESSEAYSTLFMELITDAGKSAEFVNGVVPQGLAEEAKKLAENRGKTEIAGEPAPPTLAPVSESKTEPQIITKADITQMSSEEIANLGNRIAAGEVKLSEDPADL